MSGPRLSIIPARAATDRALKPRDLQVLCVLGRHTDDLGWCRKSQVKMADEIGCARSTVFEAIERLVNAGYLERHVQESPSGRDSAHLFRVVLDPVHPSVESVPEAPDLPDSGPPTPCRLVGTPAGISAPPAGPEPAPPAGPGPAPINDSTLTTPSNGESARAGIGDGRNEEREPGRRAFKTGFSRWPTYLDDSDALAFAQFEACSPDERREGLERQAEYVASVRATGRSNFRAYSVYWNQRLWTRLPQRGAPRPRAAVAPPWGPAWMQGVLAALLGGPIDPGPVEMTRAKRAAAYATMRDMLGAEKAQAHYRRMGHEIAADGSLIFPDDFEARMEREHRAAKGWPEVNALYAAAREGRAVPLPAGFAVASDMEPVPVGLKVWGEWRAAFERHGWPWLPDPGKQPVVYFPRGGPDGLEAFERSVRQRDGGDDGGGREAAE